MDLVVITKRRGTLCRLRVGVLLGAAVFAVLLVPLGIGAGAGYLYGLDHMADVSETREARSSREVADLVNAQRARLAELARSEERSLAALTARLGQLQAEVTRLNALATRVVDVAGLDPAEFAFDQNAAVGGPADSLRRAPSWADLAHDLGDIRLAFQFEQDRLEAFEQLLRERELSTKTVPSGRPVKEGWISSGYGYRADPISGNRAFHHGIDFAGRRDSHVLAVAAGVVTWSGTKSGYGNVVEIKHGNGYLTRYAHNRKNLVGIGDRIEKDQEIALLGSTGRSTGPHVHFEVVKDGRIVNPWNFIRENAATQTAAATTVEGS